jgi:hypothetical protein
MGRSSREVGAWRKEAVRACERAVCACEQARGQSPCVVSKEEGVMQDKWEPRAVYWIGALAEVGHPSRSLMEPRLREAGVRRVRLGRTVVIQMSELEQKTRLLWESLQTVHVARRAVQRAPKTGETMRRRGFQGERL